MTVTPLEATHRISIQYNTHDQVHDMQVYCNATPTGIGPGHVLTPFSGSPILFTDAADDLGNELRATLLTTDTVDFAVLEEYNNGQYIPVESHTLGVVGTQTASGTPFSRITGTFRDAAFNVVKIVVICDTYFTPSKSPDSALPSPFSTFWESFRTQSAGRAGMWARGRSAGFIYSNTSVVGSLDRKSRRRAGLA